MFEINKFSRMLLKMKKLYSFNVITTSILHENNGKYLYHRITDKLHNKEGI